MTKTQPTPKNAYWFANFSEATLNKIKAALTEDRDFQKGLPFATEAGRQARELNIAKIDGIISDIESVLHP